MKRQFVVSVSKLEDVRMGIYTVLYIGYVAYLWFIKYG